MPRIIRALYVLPAFILTAALVLGGLAGDAQAYKRKSTATGSGGKSVTQDVEANKTGSGYNRSSTTTGPNDKSVSKDATGTWDSSTNTWNKDKTVTGPKGKSKSWEKSTTISK
ncbi:MAG: hypothetical protein HY795_01930 [Desulfovibrio sp.]|jgi:hypothetical protein|nr:hypothetical protein [Desulfovibrio sp.]MBI4961094.1 hypothetical protein [Desulfovibrio sp.]